MTESSPEVPFPAEYTGGLVGEADGQSGTDGRMTWEECVAALEVGEALLDSAYSVCSETIAAFDKDGPGLVAKAQEQLLDYCLPKRDHDESLVQKAQQVSGEIERWLQNKAQFTPLLDLISGTTDFAVRALMAATVRQIKALPSYRTALSDAMDIIALIGRFKETLDRGDEISDGDLKNATAKLDEIKMGEAKTEEILKTVAESGFLAETQIAATLQTIAGYIEARRAYLMTYLEATDSSGESNDANQHIALRDGAIQLVYDAITTAVGQYAPLVLPKLFTQVPLIGGGFAILDVARTINEKRTLVEERKNHLLELAEARRGRGDTDEMFWLRGRLKDDRAALDALVASTVDMCRGVMKLPQFPQADPPPA